MKRPVYMDHQATTPVDERVLQEMLPYFSECFGNPSSGDHVFGWGAEAAVDNARGRVAALIGCDAGEVVFTGGATESDNLALTGVFEANRERGKHIVTVSTEHKAVLDTCRALGARGARVTLLPVAPDGRVDLAGLRKSISSGTLLVSVMLANNEIGVVQPIAEIGRICRGAGVVLHCDAAQGVGRVPVDVRALGVDLLSFSGHKMYGPKGIGALYVRGGPPRLRLSPIVHGGGQERGLRSGTLNVPGIIGLGAACELSGELMESETRRLVGLGERMFEALRAGIPGLRLNGHRHCRLPGNLHITVPGVEAEALVLSMEDVAVSTGSACTSAEREPSHVLRAIGVPDELLHSGLRIGLGRSNTEEEVDYVVAKMTAAVYRLRSFSPAWAT